MHIYDKQYGSNSQFQWFYKEMLHHLIIAPMPSPSPCILKCLFNGNESGTELLMAHSSWSPTHSLPGKPACLIVICIWRWHWLLITKISNNHSQLRLTSSWQLREWIVATESFMASPSHLSPSPPTPYQQIAWLVISCSEQKHTEHAVDTCSTCPMGILLV